MKYSVLLSALIVIGTGRCSESPISVDPDAVIGVFEDGNGQCHVRLMGGSGYVVNEGCDHVRRALEGE